MGNLRDQIFYRAINDTLDRLRNEMCLKYKPKKENRFFVNQITYEVGQGRFSNEGVVFEISSKIPHELFPKKGLNLKYFNILRDAMQKGFKKPYDVKMENIVRSLAINELKERDYVKCIYLLKPQELYSDAEIDKIIKAVNAGKMQLPEIPGITTPGGKAVILKMQESVYNAASRLVADFIKANDAALKQFAPIIRQLKLEVEKEAARQAAAAKQMALKIAAEAKKSAARKPAVQKALPPLATSSKKAAVKKAAPKAAPKKPAPKKPAPKKAPAKKAAKKGKKK